MEKSNLINFTIIYHPARIELGLTCNEYCVADTIYHLSNNPSSRMPGWCYASKKTLGAYIGISKQSIHAILKKLIYGGLIEIDTDSRYLKTTSFWYDKVVMPNAERRRSKENLPVVKNRSRSGKRSLLPDSKETLHNNNISNKDNYIDNNKATVNFTDDDLIPF